MSRKYFILVVVFFISGVVVSAQDIELVLEKPMNFYDFRNSLAGRVFATDSLNVAMAKYVENNKKRTFNGYRLRIFFDNSQNARSVSEKKQLEFSEYYPKVPVFRVYDNPYWRITVGSFRTKSEAMKFRKEISGFYPSVFLVRETFSTI